MNLRRLPTPVLATLLAVTLTASAHAADSSNAVRTPTGAIATRTQAARPAHALSAPQIRSAQTLPTLAKLSRRLTPAAIDTFLLLAGGSDSAGTCANGDWRGEDRVSRVYAHVSDRFTVNQNFFSATQNF